MKFDATTDINEISAAVQLAVTEGRTTTVTGPFRTDVVYAVAQAVRDASRKPLRLFTQLLPLGEATTAVDKALTEAPDTVVIFDDVRGLPGFRLDELVTIAARPGVTAIWVDLDN